MLTWGVGPRLSELPRPMLRNQQSARQGAFGETGSQLAAQGLDAAVIG